MHNDIQRVEKALQDLRAGKMVVLTDPPDRENEGDLIIPAEKITTESMNFMIREGSGIVCLSITDALAKKLQLPIMSTENDDKGTRAPFTMSIDA